MKWKYRTARRRRRRWAAAVILAGMAGALSFCFRPDSGRREPPIRETITAPAQKDSPDQSAPIPVPLLSQEQLGMPTGCELVSAYMLLEYYGCSMSFEEWIANCVPMQEFWYEDGQLCNLSPWKAFIELPWQDSGYGCYAPVICSAMQQALPNCTVEDVTGQPLAQLCTDYIEEGTPVLVWATMDMVESAEGGVWQTPDGPFEWVANEHCLVLVGADSNHYFFNDPSTGRRVKWEKDLVEERYAELGMQAVVVSAG